MYSKFDARKMNLANIYLFSITDKINCKYWFNVSRYTTDSARIVQRSLILAIGCAWLLFINFRSQRAYLSI